MNINYTVVFDAGRSTDTYFEVMSSAGVRYAFPALTALLLAVAALLIAKRYRLGMRTVVLGLAALSTVWIIAAQWLLPKYTVVARTVGPTVVSGIVRDFVPMPFHGHADERFCVDAVCFQYSDFEETSGFNHTSSHGGPIREGLSVRVTYVAIPHRNLILKLEIQK